MQADVFHQEAPVGAAMLRWPSAVSLAGLVAISLLWTMHALIARADPVLDEPRRVGELKFIRIEQPSDPLLPMPELIKPPPPLPPPARPQVTLDTVTANPISVTDHRPSVDLPPPRVTANTGFGDGGAMSIVHVQPIYPPRALSRGIEGYCVVEYTVNTRGGVESPRPVECSSDLFERASVAAALKSKYRPRIVNGEPVMVSGVRNKFRFELED